jgi:hypothetical protein
MCPALQGNQASFLSSAGNKSLLPYHAIALAFNLAFFSAWRACICASPAFDPSWNVPNQRSSGIRLSPQFTYG